MKRIMYIILGLLSLMCQSFTFFGGLLGRLEPNPNPILDTVLFVFHLFTIILCVIIVFFSSSCIVFLKTVIGGCVLGILIQFIFIFIYLFPLCQRISLEKFLIFAIPLFTYFYWAIDKASEVGRGG